ncbi:MAG TPA: hypothetical protein VLK33_15825 [Terriglobales bacterium]|nr:hypothetical protein [Terriglobales bacterium]
MPAKRGSNKALQYSVELDPYVNELCELMNCNRRVMADTLVILALAESEKLKKGGENPSINFQNKARQAGRALAKLKESLLTEKLK